MSEPTPRLVRALDFAIRALALLPAHASVVVGFLLSLDRLAGRGLETDHPKLSAARDSLGVALALFFILLQPLRLAKRPFIRMLASRVRAQLDYVALENALAAADTQRVESIRALLAPLRLHNADPVAVVLAQSRTVT